MIAIVDYGMGNLASVYKAFKYAGRTPSVTSDPERIKRADAIVLPGVGAMQEAMTNINRGGLADAITDFIESGRPFMGICLGYQLLFETGEEGMKRGGVPVQGLGILKGDVVRFTDMPHIKIPHMGWNRLSVAESGHLEKGAYMYFVHSYYPRPVDQSIISSRARHGIEFASSVEKDNIFAMQFHPEKSGSTGISIIKSWMDKNGLSGERIF